MREIIGCALIGAVLALLTVAACDRQENLPEPAAVRESREAVKALAEEE